MQAPVDSLCANHPATLAANVCDRCGTFICATCSVGTATGVFCPKCFTPALPIADRGTRFLANLIDNVVVIGPTLLAVFGFAAFAGNNEGRGDAVALLFLGLFGGFVVGGAIQIAMQVRFGQSVGKRLLKLKVVRSDGSPVELWRLILLRNVALHVAAQVCGLVSLVDALMIFTADQRCLHDLMADTIVIDAPVASDDRA